MLIFIGGLFIFKIHNSIIDIIKKAEYKVVTYFIKYGGQFEFNFFLYILVHLKKVSMRFYNTNNSYMFKSLLILDMCLLPAIL